MNLKEFRALKTELSSLQTEGYEDYIDVYKEYVDQLFRDKKYKKIVELHKHIGGVSNNEVISFETAFACNNEGESSDAELLYKRYIDNFPNSSAAHNNLGLILEKEGRFEGALNMFEIALELDSECEKTSNNRRRVAEQIDRRNAVESDFKNAVQTLENENDYVRTKLSQFLEGVRKDKNYSNGIVPIPKWKFKVLMGASEQRAESLLQQWLAKSYLIKTGGRGRYDELEYEINLFLDQATILDKSGSIPPNWVEALAKFERPVLNRLSYDEVFNILNLVDQPFQDLLKRDWQELVVNKIFNNVKSVVVLSGSIIELALTCALIRRGFDKIAIDRRGKLISKSILNATLGELVQFCEIKNIFQGVTMQIAHVSRMHRNFIHPGKEVKDNAVLDFNKADLCFASAIEVLRETLAPPDTSAPSGVSSSA